MMRVLIAFLGFCLGAPLLATNVTIVTEHATPLVIPGDKGGPAKGPLVEVVHQSLAKGGISGQSEILPWARAYSMALKDKNTLIYPISRTEEREPKFKWVGQIFPLNYYLYKQKSRGDVNLSSLEEARKFKLGVVKNDVRHQYFKGKGFKKSKKDGPGLQVANNNNLNMRKLRSGRIDLIAMSPIGLRSVCTEEKANCEDFTAVLQLDDLSKGLYMAFSNSTDDSVVEAAKKGLEALKSDGTYRTLLTGLIE